MLNYDRILKTAMREFESGVMRLVEREFEALRALPSDVAEVPWIGDQFNPHAPPEELAALKQRVAQALRARWFEFEGPRWAQPLPLDFEECIRLNNLRGAPEHVQRRGGLLSRYARDLRGLGWRYDRILPFEQYCAAVLAT